MLVNTYLQAVRFLCSKINKFKGNHYTFLIRARQKVLKSDAQSIFYVNNHTNLSIFIQLTNGLGANFFGKVDFW